MKKLIIVLIIGFITIQTIGWELIGVVSKSFLDKNKESIVREYIIQRWIESIKIMRPHCEGAEIKFLDNEEDGDLVEVYAKCNKWSL